jgi:hypothetical protein
MGARAVPVITIESVAQADTTSAAAASAALPNVKRPASDFPTFISVSPRSAADRDVTVPTASTAFASSME